jgi:hypothetical protein
MRTMKVVVSLRFYILITLGVKYRQKETHICPIKAGTNASPDLRTSFVGVVSALPAFSCRYLLGMAGRLTV